MKIELGKKYCGKINDVEFEILDTKIERDKVYGDCLLWQIGYILNHKYYTEWHTNTFLQHLQVDEVK
jgi:hypothetical protein